MREGNFLPSYAWQLWFFIKGYVKQTTEGLRANFEISNPTVCVSQPSFVIEVVLNIEAITN